MREAIHRHGERRSYQTLRGLEHRTQKWICTFGSDAPSSAGASFGAENRIHFSARCASASSLPWKVNNRTYRAASCPAFRDPMQFLGKHPLPLSDRGDGWNGFNINYCLYQEPQDF